MFIARKCSAVGLLWYDSAALAKLWAISTSAWPRITRACFSREACASRDIASCSDSGITTSRISTDCTVTPHGLDLERRFLRVVHQPEEHRVDVHRHGIGRQRLFRREAGRDDALVHPLGDRVHERDDPEQTRPAQP